MMQRIMMWTYNLFAIAFFAMAAHRLYNGEYLQALTNFTITMLLTLVIAARYHGWNIDREDGIVIHRNTSIRQVKGVVMRLQAEQDFEPGDTVYTVYVKGIGTRALTKPWTPNDLPFGKAVDVFTDDGKRWVTVDISEGVSL